MKRVLTILKIMSLVFALTFILSGCTKAVDNIKIGVYVANERLASLTIGEDRTFVLNRDIATSYDPAGNYTIKGNKLLLQSNEGTIEFKINGDTLIFESGEIAESLIKEGTEFIYEEPSSIDILNQLENQEFAIQGENLNNKDDETIISFGEAFVNLYNGAVAELKKVSFKNYIVNENLLKFTDEILELTQKQELLGGHGINYGLNNEFKQSKLQDIEDNLYYLELPFEFEGSGMTSKMLIINENGFLKLVDFYFGNKDGVDTLATGHHTERKINDPNLWENEEWVKDVFDRLKEIEESLGS